MPRACSSRQSPTKARLVCQQHVPARLDEAVPACREALQELIRDRAAATGNQGVAFMLLAEGAAIPRWLKSRFRRSRLSRQCATAAMRVRLRSAIAGSPRACPKTRQALKRRIASPTRAAPMFTQQFDNAMLAPNVNVFGTPNRDGRSVRIEYRVLRESNFCGEPGEPSSRRRCGKQTCDRRRTSPGALKQLRGSASALRSDLYADPLGLCGRYRTSISRCRRWRFGPAVGVSYTVPAESSFLHCIGTDKLSKEGTFRFRPALVNNGGSIRMLRFFRALSIFRYFAATLSPQNVIPSHRIGWDSEGAAVRTPLPILKRNCRKPEPLQGNAPSAELP